MLWTLFVLLMLAWMICVLIINVGGLAIHFLLLGAVIILFTRLIGAKGK